MRNFHLDPSRIDAESPVHTGLAIFATLALFTLVVGAPLLTATPRIADLLHTIVIVSLIMIAGRSRRALVAVAILAVPAITVRWIMHGDDASAARLVDYFSDLAIFGFVLALMVRQIFNTRRVGAITLLLAVNCYLVIGVIWAGAYILCEKLAPGSFSGAVGEGQFVGLDLYYYSFVTLTTLGYGDILPVSPAARSLALAEVIIGVMFTGVIVARLIGAYANRPHAEAGGADRGAD
jgi:hypothetical protein